MMQNNFCLIYAVMPLIHLIATLLMLHVYKLVTIINRLLPTYQVFHQTTVPLYRLPHLLQP
jgi:hypothetical protein